MWVNMYIGMCYLFFILKDRFLFRNLNWRVFSEEMKL